VASAPAAKAVYVIDMTTANASTSYQGALFNQTNVQPTGTGYINPFVRIQQNGTEAGYNTDGRPVEFQTKDQNQWTHSISLSSLQTVSINGTSYYKFALDINEQGNTSGGLLSMNDFRLYLGDSPSLLGWNDGFGTHSVKVYDIDQGNKGNTTVELNANLQGSGTANGGSGSGDLFVYIPVAKFQGFGSQYQYVYLYSKFGNPNSSDAGFEEWWTNTKNAPPPGPVPAPAGLVLGLIALGGCALRRTFRRAAEAAPQA